MSNNDLGVLLTKEQVRALLLEGQEVRKDIEERIRRMRSNVTAPYTPPRKSPMAADEIVSTHSFCFNPDDNGGEGLTLTTTFFDNGDPDIYVNQELTLQSYFNSATLSLTGSPITPKDLRQLADELEAAQAAALKKVQGL